MRFPAENALFCRKRALSSRKMRFPAEKCTFLEKNAAFGGHMAGNCRKLEDGFRAQESRALANFYMTPVKRVREMTQRACSCLQCDSSSRHCRRSSAKQQVWCSSLVASCPVHWQPLWRFGQNTMISFSLSWAALFGTNCAAMINLSSYILLFVAGVSKGSLYLQSMLFDLPRKQKISLNIKHFQKSGGWRNADNLGREFWG